MDMGSRSTNVLYNIIHVVVDQCASLWTFVVYHNDQS